jgi:hypothetical protein
MSASDDGKPGLRRWLRLRTQTVDRAAKGDRLPLTSRFYRPARRNSERRVAALIPSMDQRFRNAVGAEGAGNGNRRLPLKRDPVGPRLFQASLATRKMAWMIRLGKTDRQATQPDRVRPYTGYVGGARVPRGDMTARERGCRTPTPAAYEHESEVRLIVLGQREKLLPYIKTRLRGSEIVPHIEHQMPLRERHSIVEIVVGPAAPADAERTVRTVLSSLGADASLPVQRSEIPYRAL